MTSNKLEQEAKFRIRQPERLAARLNALGAVCTQERTFELNLRFDTPDGRLSAAYQVLRLRQDQRSRLTFKGPSDPNSAVSAREEIEVEVSDLRTTQAILEALGYQVSVSYEKYRAAYQLGDVEVSLDEMPFGNFSEIEGPDEKRIHAAAKQLGLNWETRSKLSYLAIFDILKETFRLEMPNLTFAAFIGQAYSLDEIGLLPSDEVYDI
jgi:adenylate cyclase class 2